MLKMLEGLAVGWIIFTDNGKQFTNKIVNKAYKRVKKRVLKSEQFKLLKSMKDIFDDEDEDDELEQPKE